MRRTTAYDYLFEGTIVDEVKWVDLYSVSPVDKAEFGNKTTIHTVTEATARATAVKSRQLNCIASRKLPTYNGSVFSGAFDSTGLHVSGTISPTSKLVNIIAAVSVDPKIGRRDLATDVDIAQIYSVQQQLDAWSSEAGQFNYTLDSDNMSFEETILTIANAGFCNAYRQSGKIRLAFDKKQTSSTALFTHRNKKPSGESITRRFANDAEYDGVEFLYVDPETFQTETITLPLDGNYTKLKKFEIAGIRSFAQASYRANREYQKIKKLWKNRTELRTVGHEETYTDTTAQPARRLRYSLQDLDRIERDRRQLRRRHSGNADGHGLSQLLRTIGELIEQRNERLLGISWQELSISMIVENSQGRKGIDVFRPDNLYDLWVKMYLKRDNRAISDTPR